MHLKEVQRASVSLSGTLSFCSLYSRSTPRFCSASGTQRSALRCRQWKQPQAGRRSPPSPPSPSRSRARARAGLSRRRGGRRGPRCRKARQAGRRRPCCLSRCRKRWRCALRRGAPDPRPGSPVRPFRGAAAAAR